MEKECYEEEFQPYRKMDYKPIIYRATPLEMIGRVYARYVRSSMTYGSKTMSLLVDLG